MEPIAVIGLALRFSGDAVSEESFWKVIDAFHKQGDGSKSLVCSNGEVSSLIS
jgi:hypothetical protein